MSDVSPTDLVQYSEVEGVAVIRLNRPMCLTSLRTDSITIRRVFDNSAEMLQKIGQIALAFGIGKRNHAIHTRPTWKTGKMAAQTTAKMVIASAARLIDVRHFCRKRQRIAEISVPAWPIPIQKTKLTIAQPQLAGFASPQTPVPVATR